jgi:hypothetical protein
MRGIEELISRIGAYEQTIEIHVDPASVLIMPRGGRLLSVDLGNSNLLWVNPKIEDVLSNNEWNTGGIRTWVSPERGFFYDYPEKFQGWRCPQGIDPAKYEVTEKEKHAVELRSVISAQDMASKRTLLGYINKRIEVLEAQRNKDLARVRVAIHDVLTVEGFKSPFALWCLAQVPIGGGHKGILTVPVVKNARPIHYFNPIPSSYLQIHRDRIEFTLDGQKELKLGIRPEDLPNPRQAQLQYSYKSGRNQVLISMFSRTGAKNQSECVDPPRSNPTGPRAVIQSYSSEQISSELRYGEMEIQAAKARLRSISTYEAEEIILIDFRENLSKDKTHVS